MKRLLLAVLVAITLHSCKKEPVKDYQIISGKIENFRKRSIDLLGHNFKRKIKFDRKTKTFSDTLRNIKTGHYRLKIGKRLTDIYLSDTINTQVTIDAKKRTKDPVFKGGNATINKYLSLKMKKYGLVNGNAKKLFSLPEDDFLTQVKRYRSILNKLAEKANLPKNYLVKEKRNISYECDRIIINYQDYHRLVTEDKEFVVSNNFPKNLVDDIDFNDGEDYLNSLYFREILKDNLEELATKRLSKNGDMPLTKLETIHSEITDTLVKNDLVHQIAKKSITVTTNLPEFYKKYMAFSTNEKNKREITKMYNQLKSTAKGMPSPKFTDFEDFNSGDKVSLDDLTGKGKYLYIDVWATWCSVCQKEIPLLKNFEVKYHGKNIEFVSINVNAKKDYKKWRKMIENKEMGGVQLFAGQTERDLKFAKDYLIKGLPRFIILDPEGNIVTPNAPWPSEVEKLENMFAELGIEGKY